DVDEDRPRAGVENAVGGGDEAERRGHDQVARADARGQHAEMEPRRAAVDASRMPRADARRELRLETLDPGADRKTRPPEDLIARGALRRRDVTPSHRNPHHHVLLDVPCIRLFGRYTLRMAPLVLAAVLWSAPAAFEIAPGATRRLELPAIAAGAH